MLPSSLPLRRSAFKSCRNVPRSASLVSSTRFLSVSARSPSKITLSNEVRNALASNTPVVALESTIVAHGMPWPHNLETALSIESLIRSKSCVPATVALLDGEIAVGLSPDQLEHLARLGPEATKASRRDLAYLLSRGGTGATTVSATMIAAHLAGISVFATGGIGGVHRGAETTMDISADLTELGRTPVAVVCAGVKSILDIEKTLEVLETQGVPVVSVGTDDFPAFFTRKSGFKSPMSLDKPEQCARLIHKSQELGLQNGFLFAVPIPSQWEAPSEVEDAIKDAVLEAEAKGIRGKHVTPFVLSRVAQLTGGSSLESNINLVKNNATVAAEIALSLTSIKGNDRSAESGHGSTLSSQDSRNRARPLIIGGTVLDITSHFPQEQTEDQSLPGTVTQSLGGVSRNLAEACVRTGGNPLFLSCVGDDAFGDGIVSEMERIGMDTSYVKRVAGMRTAVYSAFVSPSGKLKGAVADMQIHDAIDSHLDFTQIAPAPVCSFDANIPSATMGRIVSWAIEHNVPLLYEPTSSAKCGKIFEIPDPVLAAMSNHANAPQLYATPDTNELFEMSRLCPPQLTNPNTMFLHAITRVSKYFPYLIITRGHLGVTIAIRTTDDSLQMIDVTPSMVFKDVVSVTGAGDSFAGALVTALGKHYEEKKVAPTAAELERFVRRSMKAAELSLEVGNAVNPALDASIFSED